MLYWSTVHVMNEYVDNVCICEDENNIPKDNLPLQLPLTYPKIYPTIAPGLISYASTSHFIILFVDEVHE